MSIPNNGMITYAQYTWTRPQQVMLPGGTSRQMAYDPLMRLKQFNVQDPASNVFMSYGYDHDKVDNILEKVTEHGVYAYGYDDLYRLEEVENPDILADESYTYDPVGNRLTSLETTGEWGYNTNNELTGYDDAAYEYDANGNTITRTKSGQTVRYEYDVDNRLVAVKDGSGNLIASYHTDPFGRRIGKTLYDGSGAVSDRIYYHYSDEGLIGEYRVVDGSPVEIRSYGYKPGSTWGTDPLFMKENGQYFFYHNDHLGTPQKMTDINGAVVWSGVYKAFGACQVEASSTVVNNLRFPGQYYDEETGLHYNWHRYYDAETGRYLSEDPIGLRGGINLYRYVRNNPANWVDPLGLVDIPWYIPKSLVIKYVRDRANDFGIDISKYSDEEIFSFIDYIPKEEAEEFKKSYDSRPDEGQPSTPENVIEFEKEKKMIDEWLKKWEEEKKKKQCP